jgi:stage II sporulation protein E
MQEWTKVRISADHKYGAAIADVLYKAKEKGLLVEELHVYEEKGRLCTEGYVSTKGSGGQSIKHYIKATEQAFGRDMRMGKDGKNFLTKDPVFVALYEDTAFYVLQGAATEKKSDSMENGDYFSFFSMDDGNYHICLSDGMGSGSRAKEESEMVVELMQKFIEAGFKKETAVLLLNSTMVLQGEDNSFSTLDYGVIDTYAGELELIKIGGAATYIKRGKWLECVEAKTLPIGMLQQVDYDFMVKKLYDGDYIIMMSDGVLDAVRPEIVCISAGRNNPFGHPAPELLQRLETFGCTVYRTDLHGDILIRR